MFIINVAQPLTLILLLIATILLIFLGKEIKKPFVPGIMLVLFLALILVHSYQFSSIDKETFALEYKILSNCIAVDATMIFISFFSYLWVDDISCKFYKKKSIDNSLDWFWNKV